MSPPRRTPPGGRRPPGRKKAPAVPAWQRRADLEELLAQLEGGTGRRNPAEVRRLRRQLADALAAEAADVAETDAGETADAGQGTGTGEDTGVSLADPWADERDEDLLPMGSRRWERFAEARPLPVEGGITARSRRGAIGESWWSQRFLAALEAAMEGGRATRGRTYARKGQVIDLSVGPGVVEAHVQGSRAAAYRVRLGLPAVDDRGWEAIVGALAAQAGYAARLLAGELPHEIEDVFAAEGFSLFPAPTARLTTECTCPDWSNPCKHVAAVCYLLAEAFDRDPFAVLAWRGRTRQELLDALRARRASVAVPAPARAAPAVGDAGVDAGAPGAPGAGGAADAATRAAVPSLAEAVATYWVAGPELTAVRAHPAAADVPAAVLRHLPTGVLEVGGRDVGELLAPCYVALTAAAARRALAAGGEGSGGGESGGGDESGGGGSHGSDRRVNE